MSNLGFALERLAMLRPEQVPSEQEVSEWMAEAGLRVAPTPLNPASLNPDEPEIPRDSAAETGPTEADAAHDAYFHIRRVDGHPPLIFTRMVLSARLVLREELEATAAMATGQSPSCADDAKNGKDEAGEADQAEQETAAPHARAEARAALIGLASRPLALEAIIDRALVDLLNSLSGSESPTETTERGEPAELTTDSPTGPPAPSRNQLRNRSRNPNLIQNHHRSHDRSPNRPTQPIPQPLNRPLIRWIRGHQIFAALSQGLIFSFHSLGQAIRAGRAERIRHWAELSTCLLEASGAALAWTGAFSVEEYTALVRPTMMEPQSPVNLSGLMSVDHRSLVQTMRDLRPALKSLHEHYPVHHDRLHQALAQVYDSHIHVCERFVGERPSLLTARHAKKSGPSLIEQFKSLRLKPFESSAPARRLANSPGVLEPAVTEPASAPGPAGCRPACPAAAGADSAVRSGALSAVHAAAGFTPDSTPGATRDSTPDSVHDRSTEGSLQLQPQGCPTDL